MKLTIEPTTEFFMADNVMVRRWKGVADDGSPVNVLVAGLQIGSEVLAEGLISIPAPTAEDAERWAEGILRRAIWGIE